MPFLYESRQHKRSKRESLDCALALQELVGMGVSNIITFDAHDPRMQNAIPLSGFDNFMPTYQFLKTLCASIDDFKIDNEHLMIISPDEGAMQRAVYFSNILGVDMGMFYKRRDYSTVSKRRNPLLLMNSWEILEARRHCHRRYDFLRRKYVRRSQKVKKTARQNASLYANNFSDCSQTVWKIR